MLPLLLWDRLFNPPASRPESASICSASAARRFDAFQFLDYAAKQGAKVVHFSEIRFLGSLEDEHVRKVRAHAEKLGIELEIGMRSSLPDVESVRSGAGDGGGADHAHDPRREAGGIEDCAGVSRHFGGPYRSDPDRRAYREHGEGAAQREIASAGSRT